MKRIILILIAAAMIAMLGHAASADDCLKLTMPETTTGYRRNVITAECPWEGELQCSIYAESGGLVYRMPAVSVKKGTNEVAWDGLGAWDEPIPQGDYYLTACLSGAYGEIDATAYFTVGKNAQALVFALPSAQSFNPKGVDWYVTYKMVRSGRLIIEIWQDGLTEAPLRTVRKNVTDAKAHTWTWDGKIKGQRAADGQYTLRMYAEDNHEYFFEVHVTIDGSLKKPVVDLTGSVMPERDFDIAACASAPAIVAKGSNTQSVRILAQQDTDSANLGRVYCQTQCLEVHAIDGSWAEVTAYRLEDGAPVRGFTRASNLKALPVNDEYVLVVKRRENVMQVWHDGVMTGTVPVVLGAAVPDAPECETISGSYLIGERATAVTLEDGKFSYAIEIGGNCTIYQADPEQHDGPTRGGIAAAPATDESTLSAYWLWTHIPPNTRLIIEDEPQSRLIRVACAATGMNPDLSGLEVYAPVDVNSGESEIVMTFGGDVALASREAWMRQKEAFPAYLKQYGMEYPLQGMVGLFSTDDMTVVNLECVLKDNGKGENTELPVRMRGLPEWVEVLHWGSVEHVNVANNHHRDYGSAGVESTLATLDTAGMPYSGFGATYIAEIDGHKIGFAGCREAYWLAGKQNIASEIAYLREHGCEVVVYSCHWGKEYAPAHNETQEEMAKVAVDAGADIIIGHHPHIVQGIDEIDGVPVIYSLGNLMFGGTHKMKTFDGAVARVVFRFDEDGYAGASLTMIPVTTSTSAGMWVNDFHPVPAEGEDALRIMALIQADSSILLTDDMFFPAK